MPNLPRARRSARMAGTLAILAGAASAPTAASAASSLTCDASALRASVLTAPAIEPVTANRGQPSCRTADGGVPAIAGLPVPVTARVFAARTVREGSDAEPGSQAAGAFGGVADLSLGLPALPITLPVDQIPAALDLAVPVPDGLPVLGGQTVQVPIATQLRALAPGGALPAELIGVRAGSATARAACVDGEVRLSGSSQVLGLRVLGQEIPSDAAVTQVLDVVGGGAIDPSRIDAAALVSQTPALAPLGAAVQPAVQQALDALPDIPIPAQVATLRITPAQQIREGGRLTQRALRVELSIAGRSIADLAIGEASVSAAGVACAAGAVADETLSCTKRRLALVDVIRRGRRVRLFGVADRTLIGRRVTIRFTAGDRVVARPRVRRDGTFVSSAPLPPRSIRSTNRARYIAGVGRERSLELKLVRRMLITRLTSRNGRVTIAGRVVRPLGSPVQTILVKRRVSCRRSRVVARIKPTRTGRFRVTVAAPPRRLAATYRLETKVRKFARNPKLYRTYTLPRAVEVR